MAIKLRFSLRWLLILFAVFGVLFYFVFVSPTVVANRLVNSINNGDLSEFASIKGSGHSTLETLQIYNDDYSYETLDFRAQLMPFDWRECFARGLIVYVSYPKGASPDKVKTSHAMIVLVIANHVTIVGLEDYQGPPPTS